MSFAKSQINIAVASNFYHSLEHLIIDFKKQHSNLTVNLISGSTGLLYAQIKKGAPFDLFLAADSDTPNKLLQFGLTEQVQSYAVGQLVVWPSTDLSQHSGNLVIANPKLAPYGKAAMQVLKRLNLTDKFKNKQITANNVNQAFQFVDTGNADVSLLAESQLLQAQNMFPDIVRYRNYERIQSSWHQPIVQQGVILKRTSNHAKAEAFMSWLLSKEIQSQLVQLGYGVIHD